MLERLVAIWAVIDRVLTVELFSIGGSPVTSIGVVRVIVVVCMAALASRLIRTTLSRVSARWPGTDRAALYTVGRVAHYLLLALGISLGLSTHELPRSSRLKKIRNPRKCSSELFRPS